MNVFLLIFLITIILDRIFTGEISPYFDATNCNNEEYFKPLSLKCISCLPAKHLKPTDNKLGCECDSRSKITKIGANGIPECELCPENHFPTSDQRNCLPCVSDNSTQNFTHPCNSCFGDKVLVENNVNGSLKAVPECVSCTNNSIPDPYGKSCIPCPFSLHDAKHADCSCPSITHEILADMCIPRSELSDWPDERSTYLIHFGSKEVDSLFFRNHLRSSVFLCKQNNEAACQRLANMCTVVMFQDDYKTSPCTLFKDSKHIPAVDSNSLPWIYYGEGDAPAVLSRKKITTAYSLNSNSKESKLNLTVTRFTKEGEFLGIFPAAGHLFQLCPGSWVDEDNGLRFGSQFQHACVISAKQLVSESETEFFDVFLQYWDDADSYLYAVPVLNLNTEANNKKINKAGDESVWQLTRRLFFVDKISGIESLSDSLVQGSNLPDNNPSVVRYLKSLKIRVKVQGSEVGKIYPPLLITEYGEVTREDILEGKLVSLTFTVVYEMDNKLNHIIEVSMGVMCGLAVVWSCIETWSHSRRSGKFGIDLFTLAQLALFSCGNLANVFFIVTISISTYKFWLYKGQSVADHLLPSASQESLISSYIIAAFCLKCVEVAYMIWMQVSVDIFFIDWERPRARSTISHPRTHSAVHNADSSIEQPVSIWRTYFVANEWNELQTTRKISLWFQLMITVFILKIVGVEHWAVADPAIHISEVKYVPVSLMCQFAVGVCVYLVVYIAQWIFFHFIYERFIKNEIQEFVDICSLSNISIFILYLENYGFYIHGRSAHGFADTDMQTILTQLQREEEDLCGHRGLLPGSDHQTFQMTVPFQLRAYYRKVMSPISSIANAMKRLSVPAAGGLRTRMASGTVDRSVQAYHDMNRFLAAFLEHALKDLDYDVKEKAPCELFLDIEFSEVLDKGLFYIDNGHSFDRVLFYGNEFTLASFDIILFSLIQILTQDFLLAAVVTAVIAKVLIIIRNTAGRRNLATKTLIDERFLI